ncbi:DUF7344 domain-containing protein [Halosolutus gelatinilyticus]|uniref:DUF7344 domain-containing protein n=1 Tax=Halosolutus gelatinilyticus TaxID=2931975 RepID=UPI001FF33796|nr:hypothetical protein [Halosolutus gelatinilyticus]
MVEQLRLEQVETPEFVDTIYTLLASSQRRNVLQFLIARRDSVSIHRLAVELAAIDLDVPVEDVTSEQQENAFLSLSHIHLPLLRDTGVISWDQETEQIELTSLLSHLSVTIPESGGLLDVSLSDRSDPS